MKYQAMESVAEANRNKLGDYDSNQFKHYRTCEVKKCISVRRVGVATNWSLPSHLVTSSSHPCRHRRRRRRAAVHSACVAGEGPGTTRPRVGLTTGKLLFATGKLVTSPSRDTSSATCTTHSHMSICRFGYSNIILNQVKIDCLRLQTNSNQKVVNYKVS
jgi:hypothetical protein